MPHPRSRPPESERPRLPLWALALAALACLIQAVLSDAQAASRIKDLVDFEGIRENQLVGYGLVVGVNGTGDSLRNAPFTRQSLQAMLERLGINTRDADLRTANVAAVMVTSNLPAFSTQGTRIDVTVSALGDASSLQGGTLLVTPLHGADGEVYAVAQGPLAVGGFAAEGEASSITRGVPTVGRISNGAIVEREIKFHLAEQRSLRLALRNPDLTTAKRIAIAINAFTGTSSATPVDPATVRLDVLSGYKGYKDHKDYKGSKSYKGHIVRLLMEIEQLRVEPDQSAKVVVDESTGVIVMGRNVRVSTVAIAQGNLTVTVTETPQVSQPAPLSENGQTVVVPRTRVTADDESNRKLAVVQEGITLSDLVDGLNALGIGPRDMIAILQAVKAAGALQAEIEVM